MNLILPINPTNAALIYTWIFCITLSFFGLEFIANLKDIRIKRICISGISMILIAWMDIWSLFLLCFLSTFVIYIIKKKFQLQKKIYPISIAGILILLLIKDYGFITGHASFYVPLGISYYFFRLLSFLIDQSRNPEQAASISLLDYFSWVFFFPVFLSGPIIRFHELKVIPAPDHLSKRGRFYRNLILAAALKIVLVDLILYNVTYDSLYQIITYKLSDAHYMDHLYLNLPYLTLFSGTAFFHAYLDLMLYTEISKALAGILGFTNIENFHRPFLASNISDFWQRWHLSLSNWTRDYVFFPTLIKTKKTWLSIYASMMVIGIWHSATLNWITWALLHASAINLYSKWRQNSVYKRIVQSNGGRQALKISGNIVTLFFVMLVFTFVAIPDFKEVIVLFSRCF